MRVRPDGKNIVIAWIYFEKAYDIVLQSWIINCLKMYKISDRSHKLYRENHENLESGIDSRRKNLN